MNENRNFRTWPLVALGAVAIGPVLASSVACGGNKPPENQANANASVGMGQPPPPGYPGGQQPPPGYPGYAQGGQQPPPGGQPGYPPGGQPGGQPAGGQPPGPGPQPPGSASATPPPLAPTDPSGIQAILQGLAGALQGQTVNPGTLPGDLTDAGLKAQAMKVAPGMQPEGDELKQNLGEGQHAVMMVTMQAGKCYTLVGYSPPGGVKDLDLNLLAPPLFMTLAGQDLTHNNTPAIGASPSPMCPVIAFPLQYKLDVFAKSGGGQVAVQMYSKAK